MNAKRLRHKLVVLISGVVLFLTAILLAGLVYFKLIGLKTALADLVAKETNQEYQLTIQTAKVNLRSLSFAFDGVTIQRNENRLETGIKTVYVAHVRLQVANLPAMFRSKQYDIRSLIISEPRIEIDKQPSRQDSAQAKFHLGQQIVKLYPPIEEVLRRFNVEYLTITGAGIAIEQTEKPSLSLNLVDFLVAGWQQNKLTAQSQIELSMGKQDLQLEQADFSFSSVAFNLQEHLLQIEDIKFSTADSITGSHVKIRADALKLKRLGYQELFENQRLTYSKVTVQNPQIDLRLVYDDGINKDKDPINEQEVVTRIIKQSIGECIVDTVQIENAAFKTVLYRGADSTFLEVPQFDFTLYTFKVVNDRETFFAGPADIELYKTKIALNGGIQISCQNLRFDQAQNLNFYDVTLYDAVNNMEVLECSSLALVDFHLLPLLFNRELLIKKVTLTDAVLKVPETNIFGVSGQEQKTGLSKVDIQQLRLENVALQQKTAQSTMRARGIWLDVEGLTKAPSVDFAYLFQNLRVGHFSWANASEDLTVSISNFTTNGNFLQAGSAQIQQKALHMHLRNVHAQSVQPLKQLSQLNLENWDSIFIGDLDLLGNISAKANTPNFDDLQIHTNALYVEKMKANFTHQAFTYTASGNQLHGDAIRLTQDQFGYSQITGVLSDFIATGAQTQLSVQQVSLDLPQKIVGSSGEFTHNTQAFSFAQIGLNQIKIDEKTLTLQGATIAQLSFKEAAQIEVSLDSLHFKNIHYKDPKNWHMASAELFSPNITFLNNLPPPAGQLANTSPLDFIAGCADVKIHPGKLKLPEQEELTFGTIQLLPKSRELHCAYVRTTLPKFTLDLSGLSMNKTTAQIDSIKLLPNQSYRGYKTEEQSIVTAKLYQSSLSGFNIDDVLRQRSMHGIQGKIAQFYISSFRDKRLPAPPYAEKPASLGSLLTFPSFFSLQSLALENGAINIGLISRGTGQHGTLNLTNVWADVQFNNKNAAFNTVNMQAKGELYGAGPIQLTYTTLGHDLFALQANVQNFDLEKLNKMVLPLQAVEIKSGQLVNYDLDITANNDQALGKASMTYKKLHLIIYKKEQPEKKNIGSTLLTLFTDGFVVRDSKKNADAPVSVNRVKEKGTFHYWVSAAVQGALTGIKQGKGKRRR